MFFRPLTLTLCLIIGWLGNQPVSALEIPATVINGLYQPTSSQEFFDQGRKQFTQEIEALLKKRLSPPETLLKIDSQTSPQWFSPPASG